MNAEAEELTELRYWDDHWAAVQLPQEARHQPGKLYLNEILRVFDRFLPHNDRLTALEVGGAPGTYLAYVRRAFGYRVACLDYSATGCEATERNCKSMGISVDVYNADLFDDRVALPQFDVVYSLGLIEHFSDPVPVVARHIRLLKPGGILLLGVPNFLGINLVFLSRLAPGLVAQHELSVMDLRRWETFEERFNLEVLFKGYVGGFEPGVFRRREDANRRTAVPYFVARVLSRLLSRHGGLLRRLNSRWWSGYAMAVYRRPLDERQGAIYGQVLGDVDVDRQATGDAVVAPASAG
jgi:SAM-dependent methyltransferase